MYIHALILKSDPKPEHDPNSDPGHALADHIKVSKELETMRMHITERESQLEKQVG